MSEQITLSIPTGCSEYARAARDFFAAIYEVELEDEDGLAQFGERVNETGKKALTKEDVTKIANDAGIETVDKDEVLDALKTVDETKPDSQKINPRTNDDSSQSEKQTNAPGGQELDSEGLWWCPKIHVASKTKIANGTWRLKKTPQGMTKLDWDHFVLKRKEDIKKTISGFDFDLKTGAKKPKTDSDEAAAPPPGSNNESSEEAAAPPPPGSNNESSENNTDSSLTYPKLMARVIAGKRSGELTDEIVDGVAEAIGISCVGDLGKRTDLLEEFITMCSMMYNVNI